MICGLENENLELLTSARCGNIKEDRKFGIVLTSRMSLSINFRAPMSIYDRTINIFVFEDLW